MQKEHPVEPVFTLDTIGGLKCRFDFNVLAEFEQETGKQLASEPSQQVSAYELRLLVWLMAKQDNPEITVEDIGKRLHFGNFEALGEELDQLFSEMTPEGAGGQGNASSPG